VPKVSVIVPVRNGERHIRRALGSICRQTLADLEIIVVDDGSEDSTPMIIEEFAASDDRVRIIDGPAIGSAGAARNAGLDLATGDYLAFLDGDDFFAPQLLSRLHERIEREHADVAVTGFRVVDERTGERKAVDWGLRTSYLPSGQAFAPSSVGGALFYAFGPVAWNKLFRADLVRAFGLRFQPLRRTNDLLFTFSALAHAERLTYLDERLIDYRVGNPGSLQGSTGETPLDFAAALDALQVALRAAGIYERFEAAFINEAAEVCLTNLDKATDLSAFRTVHDALRSDLLERYGVVGFPAESFVTPRLAQRVARLLDSTAEEHLLERVSLAQERELKARADAEVARLEADQYAAALSLALSPQVPESVPVVRAPAPDQTRAVPDVSVVIPVHNSAPWLQDCLDGVRRQTGVLLEVICVDDGSTDSSAQVLEHAALSDDRIRIIHQPNAGLSVARNRGMADAIGRYVCFLDSDDYWGIDGLSALVQTADQTQADAVLFDADTIADPGVDAKTIATYHRGYYHRSRAYDEVVAGPVLMAGMKAAGDYRVQACLYLLRTSFLRQHQLTFRPGLPREDNLFTFAMLLAAERTTHRRVALYTRRLRPGSLITGGTRSAAARGYYVTFVEMLRLTASTRFEDEVGRQVGATAFKAFRQAKVHFERLDADATTALGTMDSQPDAQAILLILLQAQEAARRRQAGKRAAASGGSPAKGRHTPLQRARRLAGRCKRYVQRILRTR
jgi:glycosyltransferase involved in cell wall biosynthesis